MRSSKIWKVIFSKLSSCRLIWSLIWNAIISIQFPVFLSRRCMYGKFNLCLNFRSLTFLFVLGRRCSNIFHSLRRNPINSFQWFEITHILVKIKCFLRNFVGILAFCKKAYSKLYFLFFRWRNSVRSPLQQQKYKISSLIEPSYDEILFRLRILQKLKI